jgi:phage repressor protein C with HTH and peptisase S24 domain
MLKKTDNTDANPFMDVYRRIQLATNTRTQSELATILEVRQSSISDAKRRGAVPSGWYITLFEKFGLSQDWLRHGVGPMYLRTEQGYVPQAFPAEGAKEEPAHYSEPAAKSKLVTVYSMYCKPNGEELLSELEAIGKLALPASFARQDTLVLRMRANNMTPTVRRNAYLGVDTADTRLDSGAMFVLKDEHAGLLVRRIFLDCSTQRCYYLRSDDDSYPESAIHPEELRGRIVGRVSWVMQEIF